MRKPNTWGSVKLPVIDGIGRTVILETTGGAGYKIHQYGITQEILFNGIIARDHDVKCPNVGVDD